MLAMCACTLCVMHHSASAISLVHAILYGLLGSEFILQLKHHCLMFQTITHMESKTNRSLVATPCSTLFKIVVTWKIYDYNNTILLFLTLFYFITWFCPLCWLFKQIIFLCILLSFKLWTIWQLHTFLLKNGSIIVFLNWQIHITAYNSASILVKWGNSVLAPLHSMAIILLSDVDICWSWPWPCGVMW